MSACWEDDGVLLDIEVFASWLAMSLALAGFADLGDGFGRDPAGCFGALQ